MAGQSIGIRTADDDRRHPLAEALGDSFRLMRALILDRIMQEGYDRLLLVTSMLEHEARDIQQVRDVRDVRPLACLVPRMREAKAMPSIRRV